MPLLRESFQVVRLFVLVQFLFGACMVWAADGRVALVIGNGAYEHAPPLDNPINDAAALSTKLEGLGFNVIQATDLDAVRLQSALCTGCGGVAGWAVTLWSHRC